MRVPRPRKWHLDDRGPQVQGSRRQQEGENPQGRSARTRGSSSKRQHARSRSSKTSTTNHCCFPTSSTPPPPTEIQESAPVAVARAPEWGRHQGVRGVGERLRPRKRPRRRCHPARPRGRDQPFAVSPDTRLAHRPQTAGFDCRAIQYGHVHVQMTLGYSGSYQSGFPDEKAFEDWLYRLELLSDDYDNLRSGEHVSGPAASVYCSRVEAAHHKFGGRVLKNTHQAKDLLANPLLQIFPARAMTCVFDPDKALCQIRTSEGDKTATPIRPTAGPTAATRPTPTATSRRCATKSPNCKPHREHHWRPAPAINDSTPRSNVSKRSSTPTRATNLNRLAGDSREQDRDRKLANGKPTRNEWASWRPPTGCSAGSPNAAAGTCRYLNSRSKPTSNTGSSPRGTPTFATTSSASPSRLGGPPTRMMTTTTRS